jgi:hypothetical protein
MVERQRPAAAVDEKPMLRDWLDWQHKTVHLSSATVSVTSTRIERHCRLRPR